MYGTTVESRRLKHGRKGHPFWEYEESQSDITFALAERVSAEQTVHTDSRQPL